MESSVVTAFPGVLHKNLLLPSKLTGLHEVLYLTSIALFIINLLLCIISLTFGVVSWILIANWRRLQNYVFMNLIFSSTINMIGYYLCFHHQYSTIAVVLILLLPRIITTHWLLVANVMFYMEFVKVFNFQLRRKYLIINTFSWLVPLLELTLVFGVDKLYKTSVIVEFCYGISLVLLSTSVILYVVMVSSSLTVWLSQRGTWRGVLLIVASGIPSGFTTLLPLLTAEVFHSNLILYGVVVALCMCTITAGYVAFLSLKSHRVLWTEYLRKRRIILSND